MRGRLGFPCLGCDHHGGDSLPNGREGSSIRYRHCRNIGTAANQTATHSTRCLPWQAWEPIQTVEEHAAFLRKDFPALPPEWIPEVGAAVVGWVLGGRWCLV